MRILGIETSCDETAAAVVEAKGVGQRAKGDKPYAISSMPLVAELKVLSNVVASQVKIHAKTGGVVPEVAARVHIEKIIPVVERGLKASKSTITQYSAAAHDSVLRCGREIDVIAVTAGPGLVTSLLVGVEVARMLSWLWKKPVIAVNHLAGHVYANFLPAQKIRSKEQRAKILTLCPMPYALSSMQFPVLALIVSGGHTELVLMRDHLDFKIIGETRDDAAGEAFDKVAKMLGLPYPGGPAVSALAEKFHTNVIASEAKQSHAIVKRSPRAFGARDDGGVVFPRPMIDSPDFDFSFSGLKTAVLYWLRAQSPAPEQARYGAGKEQRAKPYALSPTLLAQVCHAFQEAVTDVLVSKTIRAAKKYGVKTVLLGGGVAANKRLRERLQQALQHSMPYALCSMPPVAYATDNAAMIAAAGYFMARAKQFTPWQKLDVDSNWELGLKLHPLLRR